MLVVAAVALAGCGTAGDETAGEGPEPTTTSTSPDGATDGGPDGATDDDEGAGDTTTTTVKRTTTTTSTSTTTTVPPPPMYRSGDSGPEVAALQQRLLDLGYRPGAADGNFGAATASAVMAFQKREGLSRDGIAGPQVLARLQAPQGAGPRRGDAGPWVEVDLARQIVFVADGSGVVRTLNTSTGNGQPYSYPGQGTVKAITPTGTYSVYRTVNAVDPSPLGVLYRPLYFTGGYALHGSPSVPAYPASHGCVRLSNADADWLWTFAGVGTSVTIY